MAVWWPCCLFGGWREVRWEGGYAANVAVEAVATSRLNQHKFAAPTRPPPCHLSGHLQTTLTQTMITSTSTSTCNFINIHLLKICYFISLSLLLASVSYQTVHCHKLSYYSQTSQ